MTERAAGVAQVRQLFDSKAATWSAKYSPDGRLTGRLSQLTAAVERVTPPGGIVLDLGCGTGELARRLAATGLRVTGCDISPAMLDRAAQADPTSTVKWTALDPAWITLPFTADSFNVIVASSVLEYVEDPLTVLNECFRLLQPGGILHCTVPDLRHPVRWLEGMLAFAARAPITRAKPHGTTRIYNYQTYLRISRQRHSSRWWNAVAMRALLSSVRQPSASGKRLPLRLISFQKLPEMRDGS